MYLVTWKVIEQNMYLITRYSYIKRKASYYKILLLTLVSRYYLQDTKIRCCPSLMMRHISTECRDHRDLDSDGLVYNLLLG